MRTIIIIAYVVVALVNSALATATPLADPVEVGRTIYYEGRDSSGDVLQASVRSDTALQGASLACVHCHRRSGLGSSESSVVIPPVNGSTLFSAQKAGFNRIYLSGKLGNIDRPAYTLETLARALRDGIDATDKPLLPLMPRYQLSDVDIASLAAYLDTLSSKLPPGINDTEIHFATVIAPDAAEGTRKAMQDVFNAYSSDKNAGTRSETRRAERAPFQKEWSYSAYRKWIIHQWELKGSEESWEKQLESHYAKQPVFALLGGLGGDQWQPVHSFCEQNHVPCLFPHIKTPPAESNDGFYSIYFSDGLRLEARALAADLDVFRSKSLVQVRREGTAEAASQELHRMVSKDDKNNINEVVISEKQHADREFWLNLMKDHSPDILVLWLEQSDLTALEAIDTRNDGPESIYLSSTLLPDTLPLTRHPLAHHMQLLHPYMLPDEERKTARFQVWARQAGITLSALRLQADTYFTATLAGEALMHIRNNLSREYFIERIEHMTDNMLYTSFYPRLTLAPGQRHAAKGAYVWRLDQLPSQARWIVP